MNRASLCTALTLFVLIGALGVGNPFLATVEGQMPMPVQPSGPTPSSDGISLPTHGSVGHGSPTLERGPMSMKPSALDPRGVHWHRPGSPAGGGKPALDVQDLVQNQEQRLAGSESPVLVTDR